MAGKGRGPCPQLVPMNPMPRRRGGRGGVGVGWGTGRALFFLRPWLFLFFPYSSTSGVDSNRPGVFPTPSPPSSGFQGPCALLSWLLILFLDHPFRFCVCTCACVQVCSHPWQWAPCQPPHCHLRCLLQPRLLLSATFGSQPPPQHPSSPPPSPQSLISY